MPAATHPSETLEQITRHGLSGYLIGGRFIPRMAGGETDDKKDDDPPNGGGKSDDDDDPDEWDKERAAKTIRRQREEAKALREKVKDADALRERLKAIEDKDKSETEKLAATARENGEKLTAAEARAQDLAIRLSVERAARKLGFIDEDDAYRLIERKAVELDDDGEPKNVEALLKDLAKAKPHLVKTEDGDGTKRTAEKSPPTTPKPNGKTLTRDQLIEEKAQKLRDSGSYARIG